MTREMTVSEISKKLGYEVKIVKEEKKFDNSPKVRIHTFRAGKIPKGMVVYNPYYITITEFARDRGQYPEDMEGHQYIFNKREIKQIIVGLQKLIEEKQYEMDE